MITGDHPLTARYIATELGIAEDGRILTGRDLTGLSSESSLTSSKKCQSTRGSRRSTSSP